MHSALTRPFILSLLAAACLTITGCGAASTSHLLVGTWKGRPDTFQEKRRRGFASLGVEQAGLSATPPATHGPQVAATSGGANAPNAGQLSAPAEVSTDLEAFDFEVTLDFQADGTVMMTLDGGQPIRGTWRVLSTDVGQSLIEIAADRPPGDAASETQREKRRYELEMSPNGREFTLREEGADPQFGWLYFQRVD